jgi:hypothetical protein
MLMFCYDFVRSPLLWRQPHLELVFPFGNEKMAVSEAFAYFAVTESLTSCEAW